MSVTGFDRLRPRTPRAETPAVSTHDSEGKRALFSAAEAAPPIGGAIVVECSRCDEVTALTPAAALRVAFPAVHLSVGVSVGDRDHTIGLFRGRHGSLLRCPACGRVAWTRVTLRV
jgi:uncharacterized C2H2 Zn-finger protein